MALTGFVTAVAAALATAALVVAARAVAQLRTARATDERDRLRRQAARRR